ncbi:MAG: cytochrome c maturation protein CcmE [Coriobacteriales bacterium]|nr:cytochrome c maturation protein CcmE [Coriobacteriales bacterium]MBQ6586551.1 cytochrome c maturation protein CcmE [Coriobacteriales bacterium]
MNSKMKRRLIVVSGVIVVVLAVILAVVGAGGAAKTASVADVLGGKYQDKRVQVTGKVLPNSYSMQGTSLHFAIYDEGAPGASLTVVYDGGVAATFGNDITAICTGKLDASGVLQCDELVTKCPSKYETATDALSVDKLLGYGASIAGKPVKVTGTVAAGSLRPASQDGARFLLADASDPAVTVPIDFDGALSSDVKDGSVLVVSGSLDANGVLVASNVALKG